MARSLHSYRRVPSLSEFIPSYLSAGRPPHPLDQPVLPHHPPYVSCNKVVFKGIQGDSFYPSLLHVFCWIHAAKKTPTNTSPIHTYWSFLVWICLATCGRCAGFKQYVFYSPQPQRKHCFYIKTGLYRRHFISILLFISIKCVCYCCLCSKRFLPVPGPAWCTFPLHHMHRYNSPVVWKVSTYSRNQIKSTLFIQP